MAKRKPKAPTPTALDEQTAVEAAHATELAANPVVDPAGHEDVPLYPSTPPELLTEPAHQEPQREGPKPVDWDVVGEYAARHNHRPGVDKRVVAGTHLNFIDHGNHGGMGIQIDCEKPEDKPTPEETAILKDAGFRYRDKEWRAGIDRRDPGASRDAHKATFNKFVDKFREREGGEGPSR